MANYITTILKKARNSIFCVEIEKVPMEIKETMEYLELISKEGKEIKNDYFYLDDLSSKTETNINISKSSININPNFLFNFYHPVLNINDLLNSLNKKFKIISTIMGTLSMVSIIIAQFEYEIIYYPHYYPCEEKKEMNPIYKGIYFRIINSTISVILFILSFFYNKLLFKIKVENHDYYNKYFIQSRFFGLFIFDGIVSILHPFPFFEKCVRLDTGIQKIFYSFQTFFYSLNFLKIYFVLRFFPLFSNYLKYNRKISQNKNDNINTIFAIKAFQKDYPVFFLIIVILIFVVILGINLRIFEQPNIHDKNKDYEFFTNGFWTVILSMTTVGYGDFVPKTHLGRFVIIIATFLGTFITSLTILALTRTSSFKVEESNAFLILKRMKIRKELKDTCQQIFRISHKLKQISFEKTIQERFAESEYNSLVRALNEKIDLKHKLKRELMKGINEDQEEILKNTQMKIRKNVVIIKNSLKILEKMKSILNIQLKEQDTLMQTLEQTTAINKYYIHNLFYYQFLVISKTKRLEKALEFNNNEDKNFSVDIEAFLFNKELRESYLRGLSKRIFMNKITNSIRIINSVNDIAILLPKNHINLGQKDISSLEIKEEKSRKILEDKSYITYNAINEMKKQINSSNETSLEDISDVADRESGNEIILSDIIYNNKKKLLRPSKTRLIPIINKEIKTRNFDKTSSNDLLFDSPVNSLRFNSKEKFLQTNNVKESEEDFEDNTNFEKNLLFHPISSKLLKFNEKRKNRIISPNKSNANKNITSK